MKAVVHIPLDFEQRDDVRTLARILKGGGRTGELDLAVLSVLRLWLDWARAGVEWRPLMQARMEERDWNAENLAHLLAERCCWSGSASELMDFLLGSGVLLIVANGELDGLVLNDFAKFNEHLLPGYQSIQARGGRAKEEKRRARELEQLAEQQARVLTQQGLELFSGVESVTEQEREKCIALVMGFDSVCGRSMRTSQEYVADTALMGDALRVLRSCTWEDVVLVQRYARGQRGNPGFANETSAILRGFDEFLRKAKECY